MPTAPIDLLGMACTGSCGVVFPDSQTTVLGFLFSNSNSCTDIRGTRKAIGSIFENALQEVFTDGSFELTSERCRTLGFLRRLRTLFLKDREIWISDMPTYP
jgi:hypothetical protein